MEDRLDLYEDPDDPMRPRGCFDVRACQGLGDGREPRPMVPEHPAYFDYAYSRHGPFHLLMLVEPFHEGRPVTVTPHCTTQELAHCMRELVEDHFPRAEKIRVVLGHLSTHTPGALMKSFPTLKPGVSCGYRSVISSQCLGVGSIGRQSSWRCWRVNA
jgi:hypothetical protein